MAVESQDDLPSFVSKHRLTKISVVLSSDFRVANQIRDRLPLIDLPKMLCFRGVVFGQVIVISFSNGFLFVFF